MLERDYQSYLIKKIKRIFLRHTCIVLKNDSGYMQGIPDLLVLVDDRWGVLEVKKSENETPQPNQEYYIDLMDGMSFAAFIYPENEEEVLHALESALGPRRPARAHP